MRLTLTVVFLFTAEPAAACHVFRYWAFPWPQRCPVKEQYIGAVHRGIVPKRDTDIPIPDVVWPGAGPQPDDDMRARLLLRGALDP